MKIFCHITENDLPVTNEATTFDLVSATGVLPCCAYRDHFGWSGLDRSLRGAPHACSEQAIFYRPMRGDQFFFWASGMTPGGVIMNLGQPLERPFFSTS